MISMSKFKDKSQHGGLAQVSRVLVKAGAEAFRSLFMHLARGLFSRVLLDHLNSSLGRTYILRTSARRFLSIADKVCQTECPRRSHPD